MQFDAKNKRDNAPLEKVTLSHFNKYGADEVIILESSFETDGKGGDGSLNPNDTYTGWQWILARDNNGKWQHKDHGY